MNQERPDASAGSKLKEYGFGSGKLSVSQDFVKSPVFPFHKFLGVDPALGPEMRSTGEVMGIADTFPMAFAKSQIAANSALPKSGTVFISVNDRDKHDVIPVARTLFQLGYRLLSTRGTARTLRSAGIDVQEISKLQEGRFPDERWVIDTLASRMDKGSR